MTQIKKFQTAAGPLPTPQDSTFSQSDWQSILNKAPRRYQTNGGTAIQRGNNYFIKTNNGYKQPLSQEEWEEGYLRTQGFRPTFNDETGDISGYESINPQQYQNVTSRTTGQSVKRFQSPDGPIDKKHFQNLSDREVFDIAYNPADAPEGTTKVINGAVRGEWNNGGMTNVYGDSLGLDGSKWRVSYSFYPGTNTASVRRIAKQTNAAAGQKPRGEVRTGLIQLNQNEQGIWGAPFPEKVQGFWIIDPATGRLKNNSEYKHGGTLNYFNFFK